MKTSALAMTNSVATAHLSGVGSVLGFVLLANANAVYSGRLLQSVHPFTFLFWAFVSTTLFYAVLQFLLHGRKTFSCDRASIAPLVAVNVTSAFNWTGYFLALRYLEPAIVAAIMCGFGPVSVVVLERIVRGRALAAYAYLAAAGTIVGVGFLVWASLAGLSGVRSESTSDVVIGIGAALAGGISQALTTIVVKMLGERGWTASRIMVHRFYVLMVLAALLAALGPGFTLASSAQLTMVGIAVVLGVIVPLFLLQRGILLSDPFTTSVLLALGPVLTYVFQLLDDRIQLSAASALGCVIVVGFVVYGTRAQTQAVARAARRPTPAQERGA
jgi:drug/metabolite transporter (DMT)-like permease